MIGRLRGLVAEVSEEEAVIDVAGVGYVVRMGARALGRLAPDGELTVQVESQWSEAQGLRLYGFLERDERAAFVALQSIQGVGPKAALAVLDVLPPGDLAAAVAREDKAAVARASGVGPKLAARIVAELKGKPLGVASFSPAGLDPGLAAPAAPPPPSQAGEAVAALMGLGYAEAQARRVVEPLAAAEPDAPVQVLIRRALQELGR